MTDEQRGRWTIRPLCYGEFPEVEKSGFSYGRDAGVKMSIPSIGYLVQSRSQIVLIDTGPGDPASAHRAHARFARRPEEAPDRALEAAGVRAGEIELVVLTHLHYDHCSDLDLFPAATFVVQADELRAAVDPVAAQRGMYEFGLADVIAPWMRVTHRLRPVRGEVELLPGLRLIPLPGHAAGLQGVLVETGEGPVLIAGDALPLSANLGTGPLDAVMPGIHTSLRDCEESIERMRSLAPTILPGHDWAVFGGAAQPGGR